MNWRQRVAYENPCETPEDRQAQARNPERKRIVQLGDLQLDTFLSVDIIQNNKTKICWHAWVAVKDEVRTWLPTSEVPHLHQLLIQTQLRTMLTGVGDHLRGEYWVRGKRAFHFFRALSEEELSGYVVVPDNEAKPPVLPQHGTGIREQLKALRDAVRTRRRSRQVRFN
jgi:hypothetical protein